MADRGADKPSSRTGSPDGESQVSEDRWSLHQRLAIRELIDTEASYLHMLQLCASDLRSRLQQLPQGDLDVLFSNIDDVIKVNSRFLQDLQETDSREEEQAQLIGNLFLEFQEELEGAYKVYCANYDQALLLVESYRQEPELQRQIQGIIEAVVPQAGPSGLSFLLVIPLQRITKYTLLLQKILENTLPDASAYPVLQRATSAFQAVNININEYKRRKEVASKYTKVEQLTLRERLARINTHTLSKKTTRLSQLLKQEVGLVPKTEDKEFDDLEEKFHWVSLCVTELKNNLATYLDNLEAFLRFRPQEYDLDIPEGPMGQYCNLARDLQLQAFPEFKQRLEGLVWQPLCNLAKALAGPQNLIKKRLDKLLDFERLEEKLLEVGSVTYEEEEARHTYQALNSLLVAELPQFNQLAGQWLGQMLRTFVALQRDLAKRVLQSAEGSLAQLPHHQLSEPAFRKLVEDVLSQTSHQLRSFQENLEKALPPPPAQAYCLVNCHHQLSEPAFRKLVEDVLSQTSHQLRSFQENLEKALPPPPAQEGLLGSLLNSWCPINTILVDGKLTKRKLAFPHSHMWEPLLPGAEHQVQALLSRYGPGKLYQVTGNISGAGTLDLTLPRGQIVALLQNQDTKGNRSRWLVDTGGHRGYVPAGKLKLYYVTPSEEKLREQAQPLENVRHLTPEPTSARVPSVPTRTQVVAVYPFVARSSHEVSLQAGQPVTVLEAQDKKGNPEWSLVEADGQQGYVPSSFLARALSPAPWGWSPPS